MPAAGQGAEQGDLVGRDQGVGLRQRRLGAQKVVLLVLGVDLGNKIAGLQPLPEFDGRIITVPFSFKEIDDEGLITYVADPERCARVAGLAVRHARLRSVAPADKRVGLVFSAYPTKHARIGNAVGLDTPASAVRLLQQLRERLALQAQRHTVRVWPEHWHAVTVFRLAGTQWRVVPVLNPDGLKNKTRYNANGVDVNYATAVAD